MLPYIAAPWIRHGIWYSFVASKLDRAYIKRSCRGLQSHSRGTSGRGTMGVAHWRNGMEPAGRGVILVGALEHGFYDFPFSWEFHNPNWRTPSFFRGVGWNHQPGLGDMTYHWNLDGIMGYDSYRIWILASKYPNHGELGFSVDIYIDDIWLPFL